MSRQASATVALAPVAVIQTSRPQDSCVLFAAEINSVTAPSSSVVALLGTPVPGVGVPTIPAFVIVLALPERPFVGDQSI
jgi:hypothetical protein